MPDLGRVLAPQGPNDVITVIGPTPICGKRRQRLRGSDCAGQCRKTLMLPTDQGSAYACRQGCSESFFLMQRPCQVHWATQFLRQRLDRLFRPPAVAAALPEGRCVDPVRSGQGRAYQSVGRQERRKSACTLPTPNCERLCVFPALLCDPGTAFRAVGLFSVAEQQNFGGCHVRLICLAESGKQEGAATRLARRLRCRQRLFLADVLREASDAAFHEGEHTTWPLPSPLPRPSSALRGSVWQPEPDDRPRDADRHGRPRHPTARQAPAGLRPDRAARAASIEHFALHAAFAIMTI
jgi:hypothetical protein